MEKKSFIIYVCLELIFPREIEMIKETAFIRTTGMLQGAG